MKITFSNAQQSLDKSVDSFKTEISKIRAGRLSPDIFDNVMVDVYGQKMPVNQIANINIVDASLVTLKPWDKSNLGALSKAIETSDLGINPVLDADMVRLPIPSLTEEKRHEYVKIMKSKLEEFKIAIRMIRKDAMTQLEEDKKGGVLPEDDFESQQKQLQKMVDTANEQLESASAEKEATLLQV